MSSLYFLNVRPNYEEKLPPTALHPLQHESHTVDRVEHSGQRAPDPDFAGQDRLHHKSTVINKTNNTPCVIHVWPNSTDSFRIFVF